jgi:Tfp pilus assembly protein PilN
VRPVNLIPADERRGDRTPMRTGSVSYLVVGALAILFFAVVALAFTGKKINDKESEKSAAEQELTAATAKADSLREFTDFRTIHDNRNATVTSLAQSRFDWERVMHELSLVIPSNVWLVNLTGTVSPAVQVNEGAEIQSRDTVAGPALEMIGCTTGQDQVAAFVASLEDIDGVTRVGIDSSQKADEAAAASTGGSGDSGQATEDCRTQNFIYQFKIVVAFDAVPAPATATATPGVPAPGTTPGTDQLASSSTQSSDVVPGG